MPRTLELVIIGDELLSGLVSDANVSYLGRKLAHTGLSLSRVSFSPDEPETLARILEEALRRSGLVISCGGLGPTVDDPTRKVAARLFGRELFTNKRLLAHLRRRYKKLSRTLSPLAATQAEVPRGARLISNPAGAAPGIILEDQGRTLILLPGVPAEVRAITESKLLDFLKELIPGESEHAALIRTIGLAETELAERIAPLLHDMPRLKVSYLPMQGMVDLVLKSPPVTPVPSRGFLYLPRLTPFSKEITPVTPSSLNLARALRSIRKILGDDIYAEGERSLSEVTGELLREAGATLAVAESCTGGMLASCITDVPGSSDYFLGGVVSYSNRAKEAFVDVPHDFLVKYGAVSPQVARAMAQGVRKRFRSTYGIGITGIAGPRGGTKTKPVGLVYISLAAPESVEVEKSMFAGSRNVVRERSVTRALNLLRKYVRKRLRTRRGR